MANFDNPLTAIVDPSYNSYLNLSESALSGIYTLNNYKDNLLSGNTIANPYGVVIDDNLFLSTKHDIFSALKTEPTPYSAFLLDKPVTLENYHLYKTSDNDEKE
jgi:hypothetical protein